ncbi:hypothetical protein WJX84_000043 [Apatococcus fuscideae]|uniref:HIT-type domain-containing protein n=1 Tax=Apatococcus fuscideae TaxID=2026836 RepID=A0AAW1SSP6_9CHLO
MAASLVEPSGSPARPKCKVCTLAAATYTCPRCNLPYCSLSCYKQHGNDCTEDFYREQAQGELQGQTVSREERARMQDALQRLNNLDNASETSSEQGESSEQEENSSAPLSKKQRQAVEALAEKISQGMQISEEDLSPEELRRFQQGLASGQLGSLLQPWQPWWLSGAASRLRLTPGGTRAVQPLDGPSSPQMDVSSSPSVLSAQLQESPAAVISAADAAVPEPPRESLPSLSMLTKAQPSPLLRWQLLEIVYAYCCTLRVFHGDWQDEPEEAVEMAQALAPTLAPTPISSPASAEDALLGCLLRAAHPGQLGFAGLPKWRGRLDRVARPFVKYPYTRPLVKARGMDLYLYLPVEEGLGSRKQKDVDHVPTGWINWEDDEHHFLKLQDEGDSTMGWALVTACAVMMVLPMHGNSGDLVRTRHPTGHRSASAPVKWKPKIPENENHPYKEYFGIVRVYR